MAKKNTGTKLVSLIASLALVVGLMPLPAPAFADDGAPDAGNQNAATPLAVGTIAPVGEPSGADMQAADDVVWVNTWTGLQDAISDARNGQVIRLSGNVVNPGGKDRIQVEKSVTIDLNGFTLNRNLSSVTDNGHVIEVFDGATLTIQDTSVSGGGKVTGGYSKYGGGIYVNKDATLNISGGAITGNNAKEYGGGIYLKGSLNMTGGAVSRNWAGKQGGGIYARQKSDATIQDCSIDNNEADGHGGGIYMDAENKKLTIADAHIDANKSGDDGGGFFLHWGTIEMNGGTISGNEAANDSGGGKVTSQTTLTANGVLIENNKAKSEQGGGIKNYGTATLANCEIINNSAQKQGGGIFNDNDEYSDKSLGDMTLNNCTIAGNSSGHDGGGVYSDEKLKIVGGTIGASAVGGKGISGNYAANRGNGVFVGKDSKVAAIEGALKIEDNGTSEHGQDLFLRTGQKITLSGALLSGAHIGVMAEDGVGVFTIGYKAKNPEAEPSTYFFSTEGIDVVRDGNEAKIASSWSDLQELIDETPAGGTLPLSQDYAASSKNDRLKVSKAITIDLNGYTVNRNLKEKKSNGHVIEVFDGGALTIKDSSAQNGNPGTGKITGGWPDRGGGIYVNKNASLTIEGGSISGNHSAKAGGGIYVLGNLTMTGGSVEGNQAGEAGGGIFAGAESTIKLKGAIITGNEADGDGGGINVRSQHNSVIENCMITGNRADNGGGVYMFAEGKTLTITGTVIDNNTADADGGGLGLASFTTAVNMVGGSISDNKAGSDGGGVKVYFYATFNATNVEIARNKAEDDEGGGVKTHGTTVLKNCPIINNVAKKQGGGVFNDKYDTPIAGSIGEADLTIEGCTISGNVSGSDGGGVYSSKKLAIVGGTIGASTVGGQEILGNRAAGKGGGIFIGKNAADVRIRGGITATGNDAAQGKDLYLRSGKKLALGASISGTNIGYIDMEKAGVFTNGYHTYHSGTAPETFFGTADEALPVVWSSDNKEAQLKSYWPELQAEINQAAENGTEVTLDQDYTAGSSDDRLKIPKNKIVTINLNGFTLNRNRASVTDDGHVFEVLDGATLTIKDGSDAKTGTITGGYSKWGGGIFVNAGSTLNVLGGAIEGNQASEYGGGIYAKKKSSVNIAGGAIARNKASEDGGGIYMNGVLAMTGGAVEGNVAKESGGGIYVSTDGTISMSHASIVGNISTESGGGVNMHLNAYETTFESCTIARNKSDGSGGGIRMDAGGKLLRIVDTVIEENSSGDDGGGIFLRTGAIEMTGGRISDNIAANDSGGVKVESGTAFEAAGTTISGNKATTKEGGGIKNYGATSLVGCTVANNSAVNDGGGIFNAEYDESSQGDLMLENCTISGNSTEGNGGGVYSSSWLKIVGGTIGNSATEAGEVISGNRATGKGGGIFIGRDAEVVEIEGDIVARGNSATTFGNDIYLRPGKRLTCTGALSESATMGVDLEDGTGVATNDYKDKNGSAIPADRFVVAKGYSVGLKGNEVEIKSEWAALKSQIENASDGALIGLTKDYAAGASDDRIKIPEGKHITVDLQGYTLNRNRSDSDADGHVFEVFGTLALQDTSASKTGTITGGWANNGGGINIASSGTLNLLGGTIAGNKAVERGGGIYVHGALNLRGGTIETNEAGGSGGGIGMDEGSALTLEAGAVTGNEANKNGGGIAARKNATVGVKGGPIVWGNNAAIAGSDIYLPSDVRFDVTGTLDENARMGVALQEEWGTFTSGYSDNNNVDPARYFASTSGYAVYKEHGEAALGLSTYGETEYEKPFIEWNSQINDNTDMLGGQNWMSGISGERYLNEINVPGSHDSGMNSIQEIEWPDTDETTSLALYADIVNNLVIGGSLITSALRAAAYELGSFYAKTQTTYIDQQLAEGARIFDLRLNDCYKEPGGALGTKYVWADDEENLWICHGANELTGCFLAWDSSDNFLSFSKVLGWMKDFLEKHPTETIILNIRPETTQSNRGGKIYERAGEILAKTLIATNPSTGEPYLYKESGSDSFFARYTHMPQLKDCRGKIVIMPNDSWGLSSVGGFTKDKLVENFEFPSDHTLTAGEKVVEEQQAYAQLNPDGSARIPAVADAMTNTLWMWELNCTGEDQGDAKYIVSGDSPVDLAGIVNPALVGDGKLFGPEKAGQYIGWVRMDAFRAKYAKPIWVTNFFDDLQYCTVTVKSGLKDPSDPNKTHPNYPDQEYKILKGTQLKVPGNIYKQLAEGTYLDSWKARGADAVVTCNPGDTFTVNEDVVITAQWLNEGNIPVQIVWKDGDDADKLRPHSVEFAVTTVDKETSQDVTSQLTLTDEGRWSGIVEGTVKSVVPNMDWAQGQYQSTEEFEAGAGYTFTFSHTPSATVQVAGEVIWDDDDDAVGARPESVQIRLLVNGEESSQNPITVTEENGWQFSFGELPQYVDGEKVQYSIAEEDVADYDTVIDGFSVTNTYVPSGKNLVDVYGFVNWNDGDNRNGERPESITVRLFANGVAAGVREVGEGEFGLWLFSFEDLPIRDDAGQKITYTISVDEIAKYESEVAPSGDYAFRITNTLVVLPEEKTPAEVDAAPDPYNLTYNGEERSLAKAGAASGGTMLYALSEDGEYSSDLPAGMDAGDYSVWYYVEGNMFHTDTEPECVTASIGKRSATITVDDAEKLQGQTDPAITGTVEGLVAEGDLGEVSYYRASDDEAPGTYEGVLDAKFTANPNYDVSVVKGDFTITASHMLRWLDGDGSVLQEKALVEGEPAPSYDGEDPTKAATAQYSYSFAGWDEGTVEGLITTYRPIFNEAVNEYTVRFVNDDGTELQSERAPYGAMPEYSGKTPEKAATVQHAYAFAGWSPEIAAVTGDATYTATYTETVNKYKVTFVDDDGMTVLKEAVEYDYGTPAADIERPADPTKAPTAQCTYAFAGWTPEIVAVTGDATYTATYTETAKKGTLTFDLGGGTIDGKTSLTIEADVGDVITIPEAPVRDGYTFSYWKGSKYYPGDKYTVEGDHTFTAVWEENAAAKSSPPKTGDILGGTTVALGVMAVLALCLVLFAAGRRRRER